MGNQKSSIGKLCTIENETKKAKKSHSLNTLLNGNFLIRSNSSQKLRLKFNKRSKQKIKQKSFKKNQTNAEYTSLNEYNTKNLKSSSFQDNYFSIYDDCTLEKNAKSKTLQSSYEPNLYSKIPQNAKSGFIFSYNLQPLSRLIHKIGGFSRKSTKYPSKRFDPNEEFYLNLPVVPQKLSVNNFNNDQSNLYTDMSESICSDISKIRLDEENYQSLHDQYDYISTRFMNVSLEPPPLPPASTQPCRDHVINQIITSIEPLSINNQVYYSFSSEGRSDTNNGSILLSSSSICTSGRSSLSNENLISTNIEDTNSEMRILQL